MTNTNPQTVNTGTAQTAAVNQNSPTTDDPRLSKFKITADVKAKFGDLIELILGTESMNDDERQYWFNILPIMTPDQIEKLKKILIHEKEQLSELDKKYAEELSSINSNHASEWDAFKAKEKRDQIKKMEHADEEDEKNAQEQLLNRLDEI
ncbi:hypothetical protein A2483_05765 [Candidatus Peregrinibacteria bacterium RIFOXYC2_FULL_33_13]|nr:MAG: Tetratricopeptide [Candidatus Peregrinibacteria bacterium GW2011_GWA2_33_10]KKP41254.1 MAG: hypothetical protein UR30_C0001G0101 [Candidatus Peregrinibacteria bacterium GW2011_GWC2_33_13]OGJ49325.1 MAG: hypothetical protein A2229_01490 [Candidatus Peregrinibacteria bacterium RIFOXYA2_FULL_33_7]OGJ52705.1 MAG: hypothetical protein A2483_05765 [Candidatus Peregrinibacteria bacterium RIFOXYC2_FULL_33_13]